MSLSLKFPEHFISASVLFCTVFRCLMVSTPPVVDCEQGVSLLCSPCCLAQSVTRAEGWTAHVLYSVGEHGPLNILGPRSQKYCAFRHALQLLFLPSSEIVMSVTASLCSDTVLDTVDTAEDKTNEPCSHRAYGCGKDALS